MLEKNYKFGRQLEIENPAWPNGSMLKEIF